MGACQAGGSVIDWVIKAAGVSFRHAIGMLWALDGNRPTPTPGTSLKRLPSPVERTADQQKLLKQVVDYYHDSLRQSPETLTYLEKRGLKNPELIAHFKLGYANRTLGYRITRRTGSKLRESLKGVGILRQSTGHKHFTGCLVIPILGEDGNVQGIYGRKIGDDFKQRTPSHLYLPGPHKGVWNIHALSLSKEIILCEALIDALTFFCAGYHNVTSSYGIEDFTQKHLEAFKRYRTERVLIAYDRNDAGDRAAISLTERLISQGIECRRIQFPKGMDANEYALKVKPPAKALGILINNAETLFPLATKEKNKVADSLDQVPAAPIPSVPELPSPLGVPEPPSSLNIPTRIKGEDIEITQGDRLYHIDTLDLYNVVY